LAADDFETLRAEIARTYGKLSRKVEIKRVRSICRYAYEADLIEKPVRFGPGFVGPSRRELRCERQQNGERMFEAAEIRAMLAATSVPLKAMILLGINCGFGNTDVANLTTTNLDLKGGWCNFPRPKTGISRRCPLWPETVQALRAVRPEARDKADSDLVFLTHLTGNDGFGSEATRPTLTLRMWKPWHTYPVQTEDRRNGEVTQQAQLGPPGAHVLCTASYL
jgi:integrase